MLQRLIVEFSLENRLALQAKKKRQERAKVCIIMGDNANIKTTQFLFLLFSDTLLHT